MRLPTVLAGLGLALGIVAVTPSAAHAIDPSQLPPIASADSLTAIESHTRVISAEELLGNDVSFGGSSLYFYSVGAPSHGVVESGYIDGVWTATYTSTAGFTGVDTFTYTLVDSKGKKSAPAVVSVQVTANSAPVVAGSTLSVLSGAGLKIEPWALAAAATDADGDVLWASFISGGSHGTFTPPGNGDTNAFYKSDAGFVGTDQLGYLVHDNFGESTLGVLTISVLPLPIPVSQPAPAEPVTGPVVVSASELRARSVRRGHRGLITGSFGTHAGAVEVQVRPAHGKAKVFRVTTAADGRFRLVVPSSLAARPGRVRVTVAYVADAAFQGARTYALSYVVKNGR